MVNRIDKINYYLNIAEAVSKRGTCLRRNYGAIIVQNDEVISTGYTGAARGETNCTTIGTCYRIENNIPSGQQYESCRSVHAEMNAIISASRKDMIGSTLYLVGMEFGGIEYTPNATPCTICQRLIINAGIDKVISRAADNKHYVFDVRHGFYTTYFKSQEETLKELPQTIINESK